MTEPETEQRAREELAERIEREMALDIEDVRARSRRESERQLESLRRDNRLRAMLAEVVRHGVMDAELRVRAEALLIELEESTVPGHG